MDDFFQIIGRLYVDIYQSQKILANLQDQLKIKDNEIASLRTQIQNSTEYTQDK